MVRDINIREGRKDNGYRKGVRKSKGKSIEVGKRTK